MTRPIRLLESVNSPADSSSSTQPSPPPVNSDFVVVLAALLCALICVLGLVAVVRCAWIRRLSSRHDGGGGAEGGHHPPPRPSAANKGIKKKILRSLPKQTFSADYAAKFSDCAICLAEFAVGDEIRLLPQCGHGFHVNCIDTWLGSHSSCPSCRQILVASRCHKCGGLPPPPPSSSGAADAETEARLKAREDDGNRFLP
ncbi:RING-H2 finger protein ATL80 [Linum grandiflorum]